MSQKGEISRKEIPEQLGKKNLTRSSKINSENTLRETPERISAESRANPEKILFEIYLGKPLKEMSEGILGEFC